MSEEHRGSRARGLGGGAQIGSSTICVGRRLPAHPAGRPPALACAPRVDESRAKTCMNGHELDSAGLVRRRICGCCASMHEIGGPRGSAWAAASSTAPRQKRRAAASSTAPRQKRRPPSPAPSIQHRGSRLQRPPGPPTRNDEGPADMHEIGLRRHRQPLPSCPLSQASWIPRLAPEAIDQGEWMPAPAPALGHGRWGAGTGPGTRALGRRRDRPWDTGAGAPARRALRRRPKRALRRGRGGAGSRAARPTAPARARSW
jgi:hypothetical protein